MNYSKRLLATAILLLITILSVVTFNFEAKATENDTPSTTPTETPTNTPSLSPTAEPSTTPQASPTPISEATPTPDITSTPTPIADENEVQSSVASAPIQVVNNNNNTNNNNNDQRVIIEAPEVKNVTEKGQPVYEAPREIVETPSTGPEALSLLGLIPTSIAGYLIRRKAQ